MMESRLGQAPAAMAELVDSGLSVAQCSLFDVHPTPESMSVGSSEFPTEAARWRFGGYVRESFDIAADGHVTNARAVLAYPPLVFGRNTDKVVSQFRYAPPKIGDMVVGCVAQTMPVIYKITP